MKTLKYLLSLSIAVVSVVASAEIEIPKVSGKALGVTKGKPFSKGLVFVDGRYIEPPYVVERWGNGIRINKIPVVGQVVDWTEFLKTQEGVKVTKTEEAPAETPAAAAESEPEETESEASSDDDSSLDDLFEDDPKPKKTVKKTAKKTVRKVKPAKPTTTVSYALDGEFVANDASKALVAKVNKVRTDINTTLLTGGFICFGEKYARVSGDARTADQIIESLPEIQQSCDSEAALSAGVRSARLVYLTEPICKDLYRNRRDYLKLKARREKIQSERAFDKLLNGVRENQHY